MNEKNIPFEGLTRIQAKEIYTSVLKILREKNLLKAQKLLQSKITYLNKVKWLVTYKDFYETTSNYSLEEIEWIRWELEEQSSLIGNRHLISKLENGKQIPAMEELLVKYDTFYKGFYRSIDLYYKIVEGSLPGFAKLNLDKEDNLDEVNPVTVDPYFDLKLEAKPYFKQYIEDKILITDALLDLYSSRDIIIHTVPNITFTSQKGNKLQHPLEKYIVDSLLTNKGHIFHSKIKDDNGYTIWSRIDPILRDNLGDLLSEISTRTIKRWAKENMHN